jgi:hypothetical protein
MYESRANAILASYGIIEGHIKFTHKKSLAKQLLPGKVSQRDRDHKLFVPRARKDVISKVGIRGLFQD